MVTWTFDLVALIVGFIVGFMVGAIIVLFAEFREAHDAAEWGKGYKAGAETVVFENKGYAEGWNSLMRILYDAPAADVEPVVRCENCQFFENVKYWPDGTKKVCQLLKRQVLENSFCCWGMKKETNDEDAEV